MKKLFYSAFAYMVIGVLSGFFYREFTKGKNFTGFTQLSVIHTHLLTLGFMVLLIVLVLERCSCCPVRVCSAGSSGRTTPGWC
ncbi:DUF2871 family protein [Arthrobacter sp. E3]|uniref:DUF2871 family protein n=1 Tax=Arthrobacter sp. E3 TaxID=517402 RepID=UPI0032B5DA5C